MNEDYGIPAETGPSHVPHRPPVRYLVVIDAGGTSTARLFLADRSPATQFDGGVEEVARMTSGLVAVQGAVGLEWDAALAGHSAAERAAAQVYTLDL